jgi:hypothetical protein
LHEVAARLLALNREQEQSAEGWIVAAEAAYEQLRVRLIISLGQVGFDALWARALRLTLPHATTPAMPRHAPPHSISAPGLSDLVSGGDAHQTSLLIITVFVSFFSLLVTFIGETLTFRIIYQLWPALTQRPADSTQQKEIDDE